MAHHVRFVNSIYKDYNKYAYILVQLAQNIVTEALVKS